MYARPWYAHPVTPPACDPLAPDVSPTQHARPWYAHPVAQPESDPLAPDESPTQPVSSVSPMESANVPLTVHQLASRIEKNQQQQQEE